MAITKTTKRKRPRHPAFFKVRKAMSQQYDYSECDMPCDNKTLLEALVRIKKQRQIWIVTRRNIVKASILSHFLPIQLMLPVMNVHQLDACKPKEEASIPPEIATKIVANKQHQQPVATPGYRLIPSDLEGQEDPITGSDCSSD